MAAARFCDLTGHGETLEVMVLYQALYGTQGLWVRPRAMLLEAVLLGAQTSACFTRVDEPPDRSGPTAAVA